jgi:hypothetical protein
MTYPAKAGESKHSRNFQVGMSNQNDLTYQSDRPVGYGVCFLIWSLRVSKKHGNITNII